MRCGTAAVVAPEVFTHTAAVAAAAPAYPSEPACTIFTFFALAATDLQLESGSLLFCMYSA
jgi:hypothetical protein